MIASLYVVFSEYRKLFLVNELHMYRYPAIREYVLIEMVMQPNSVYAELHQLAQLIDFYLHSIRFIAKTKIYTKMWKL